jgi:5-methylcytosine-specific restriction endonuclease McrA
MAVHKCRGCGTPVSNTWRCDPCKGRESGRAVSTPAQRPLTTTERGLGGAHQAARRAAMKALRDGDPCALCGHGMHRDQALDLDHAIPRALGGADGPLRLAHARCNRSAGARLGNQRAGKREPSRIDGSREW